MYPHFIELTEVEAGEGVGALPLCLVCRDGTILGRDWNPPSEGEETILDHHCRVEATGEGSRTLRRHRCPLHLLCGVQNRYMSMRTVYTRHVSAVYVICDKSMVADKPIASVDVSSTVKHDLIL